MKLVEAIVFATQHRLFVECMHANNIPPESGRSLSANIVTWNEDWIFIEVKVDFGKPGESTGDIRIRLRYVTHSGSYILDEVARHK